MATVNGIRQDHEDGSCTITWTGVTTSDTGGEVRIVGLEDITIHVVGSGTAQLAGSNDGTNYVSIGSALAANSITQMAVHPIWISFTTIASATVTIILTARRRRG
jgi:hypothetical protein